MFFTFEGLNLEEHSNLLISSISGIFLDGNSIYIEYYSPEGWALLYYFSEGQQNTVAKITNIGDKKRIKEFCLKIGEKMGRDIIIYLMINTGPVNDPTGDHKKKLSMNHFKESSIPLSEKKCWEDEKKMAVVVSKNNPWYTAVGNNGAYKVLKTDRISFILDK